MSRLTFAEKIKSFISLSEEFGFITIQVTDDCCLACSYCYEENKTNHYMTIDTCDKIIDQIFELSKSENLNSPINIKTKAVIFSLIGGETFMNINVVEHLVKTVLNRLITENHRWLGHVQFNIDTNGVYHFTDKVQKFIKKYKKFLQINVSLDGPKEIHDLNRKFKNNNQGSFDLAYRAFLDVNNQNEFSLLARPTLSPQSISYLKDIFEFYLNHNPDLGVFAFTREHYWTEEESQQVQEQLIQIADLCLEKNIKFGKALFEYTLNLRNYEPDPNDNSINCFKNKSSLTFATNGDIYPCLRLSPLIFNDTRINNYKLNVNDKEIIDFNKLKELSELKAIYDDECKICKVRFLCPHCMQVSMLSGNECYHVHNTCNLVKAKILAGIYFWKQLGVDLPNPY